MALDADNVSSIRSCIHLARENARATRPELTTEVWEGINQTFLELEAMSYPKMVDQGFREFFDWVKERSHLFRGAIYGTMRRGDAFTFSRLGTFIERADNTARFLADQVGNADADRPADGGRGLLSLGRPAARLQRLQGLPRGLLRHHRAAAGGRTAGVAPRHAALAVRLHHRGQRDPGAAARNAACTRLSAQINERLQRHRIDGILRSGLPRFLNGFIGRNNELHGMIGQEFMLVL